MTLTDDEKLALIRKFLEWLQGPMELTIADWYTLNEDSRLAPTDHTIDWFLVEFFKDYSAIEESKANQKTTDINVKVDAFKFLSE